MVVAGDNLDLAVRRKRLGLTQQQLADKLGIANGSALSRFETLDVPLPHGIKRADVEHALFEAEKAARKSGASK